MGVLPTEMSMGTVAQLEVRERSEIFVRDGFCTTGFKDVFLLQLGQCGLCNAMIWFYVAFRES